MPAAVIGAAAAAGAGAAGLTTATALAVGGLAMSAVGGMQQMEAQQDMAAASERQYQAQVSAANEQKKLNELRARAERRAEVREARKRAAISQVAAIGQGIQGSSSAQTGASGFQNQLAYNLGYLGQSNALINNISNFDLAAANAASAYSQAQVAYQAGGNALSAGMTVAQNATDIANTYSVIKSKITG